jgi:tRNA isopentenyl-2-thiomethyl-A-37 hydroxylase MiaE
MSKLIFRFFCKCCHREQSTDKQVNRSGYCIECYGNCILVDHNQCEILMKMSAVKFKMRPYGLVVIDEVSEITKEEWRRLEMIQEQWESKHESEHESEHCEDADQE